MPAIITTTLDCGLTLVIEPIPSVQSVALSWLVPVGSAGDPADSDGMAAMLSEMILRGAGGLTSREHSDALDRLGVDRTTDVQTRHMRLDASMQGTQLSDSVSLLVDMIRRPNLSADSLDPVRSLCIQSLDALNDDPATLVMLRLRERHRQPPFNRHGYGQRDTFENATIETLRDQWSARCRPQGSILGVAGVVDPAKFASQLDSLLAGWTGNSPDPKPLSKATRGYLPIIQSTAQVHIGAAWDAPPERDPSSMVERLGIGVLSGSTSGRLFTEVRQKRSLCYSVGASYRAGRDTGMVSLYAGTTPERAQQTLDVCMEQLEELKHGAKADEFHRASIGLKANSIMKGESTPARAAALVYDQFRLGRARTLEEVAAAIDNVTLDQVNARLAARDYGVMSVASIGPEALEMSKYQSVETSE